MTAALYQNAHLDAGRLQPSIPSSYVLVHAAGNEADVEVYANFTGFLWETAKETDALVVFAEVACVCLCLPFTCAQDYVCATALHSFHQVYETNADCFPCSIATMERVSLLVRSDVATNTRIYQSKAVT